MSILTALIALFALAPIAAPALPPPVTEAWDGRAASRGQPALVATMLGAHNRVRAASGAPQLVWDDALAADARAYAAEMSDRDVFEHDPNNNGQGENLFTGTRGAFSYAEMANGWIEESRHFRAGQFPDVSRSGDWTDVGHYTQMIWPETRQVGCAVASSASDDYLVCRYFPVGNVTGVAMRSEQRGDQLAKGIGAMADRVLLAGR